MLECTAEATDMAQRDAARLRRELDRVESRQGRCFPPELKLRAARWIAKRRASGARVAEIAAELGLAEGTVLRWSDAKPAPSRALVPVEVVPDPVAARTVTVVSPSGFRIDRLSLLGAGGFSGASLKGARARDASAPARRVGDELVLDAAGGIEDTDNAWHRIRAGATLVQLYTGFVYGGPAAPHRARPCRARARRGASLTSRTPSEPNARAAIGRSHQALLSAVFERERKPPLRGRDSRDNDARKVQLQALVQRLGSKPVARARGLLLGIRLGSIHARLPYSLHPRPRTPIR